MLAPLRDYLGPKDPKPSALLCTTKKSYFVQLSVGPEPSEPAYGEARWIRLEDLNVEHLLDFFTSIDTNSGDNAPPILAQKAANSVKAEDRGAS